MKGIIMATAKYVRVAERGYPIADVVETGSSHAIL